MSPPINDGGVGWKGSDTSRNAARDIVSKCMTIRAEVLSFLAATGSAHTSEQIAAALGRPYESVQPRLSELLALGRVEDSGKRGQSRHGKKIIAWKLKPQPQE